MEVDDCRGVTSKADSQTTSYLGSCSTMISSAFGQILSIDETVSTDQ